MDEEIEECIRKKIQWLQLPTNLKKILGDSSKEYDKFIFEFSIKNQLRFRGSLVRSIYKDEKKYYETVVHSSIQRLMLYPYHLADMIVKGLRITPFSYYKEVVAILIELEKSYDTMPNFTAADCLRLLGIGRNEYLELVAKSRSLGRRGRSKSIRSLLPKVPLNIPMQPWWRVDLGYVLEEDVKPLSGSEKELIDILIDRGSQTAGTVDYNDVNTLYRRGLVYLDVPITGEDRVAVPPLKGFVMNRVAGDYFETLLYKVFVSIDEHTSVAELAAVLQVSSSLVKQAVSLYVRLGFARVLEPPPLPRRHASWDLALTQHTHPPYSQISPLKFEAAIEDDALQMEPVLIKQDPSTSNQTSEDLKRSYNSSSDATASSNTNGGKRVALLFDSTLAAYLMMGNLSPDLKSHAVTLFEVGKLCDESLDSLLMELDKVAADPEIEGEARRYLAAAASLRVALRVLRPRLRPLDLLRCEALHALHAQQRARLLSAKYRLAISTAPLGREARAGAAVAGLPHVGPAPLEAGSPWLRLYLYHTAGYGPPSLLLAKGTVLRAIPRLLLGYSRLGVSWWGAESALEGSATHSSALPAAAALQTANAALRRAPVLLQALGVRQPAALQHCAFPGDEPPQSLWRRHAGLRRLASRLRLRRSAGYVTLADTGVPDLGLARPPSSVTLAPERRKKEAAKLRSPIESHFAVTPERPLGEAGGLSLSQMALDSPSASLEELLSPADESVAMFSQLSGKLAEISAEADSGVDTAANCSDDDTCKAEKWTILDIQFGIPLFDEELCESICHKLVEQLDEPGMLEQIKEDNDFVCADVLKFVSQCQYYPGEDMGIVKRGTLVPMPRKNLAFENGRITEWNGK